MSAFDRLMGYLDLEDVEGNPIFQVLKIKSRQEAILKVSFRTCKLALEAGLTCPTPI